MTSQTSVARPCAMAPAEARAHNGRLHRTHHPPPHISHEPTETEDDGAWVLGQCLHWMLSCVYGAAFVWQPAA
jgi:hypothetical protein